MLGGSKFDCLRQLHTMEMTEYDKDRFWECVKVPNYFEKKGVDGYTSYICLSHWHW
jgi:hypothetical protein